MIDAPLLKTLIRGQFSGYIRELRRLFRDGTSLLDLGCGELSPVIFAPKKMRKVGVDGFDKSLAASRTRHIHNDYKKIELLDAEKVFGAKSFDIVFACDVIEHFPKKAGEALIKMAESIARHRVIIFTPNGFMPQAATPDHPLQEHLSGWEVSEFRARGYQVFGINGLKSLYHVDGRPKLPPGVSVLATELTQPLVRNDPERAFQLLAFRNMG